MIKEAYCSYEVSKLLKEKGFDWSCNRVYQGPNLKFTTIDISPLLCLEELGGFDPKQSYITNSELGDIVYTAPTQQMAMAWLREEKNIFIVIEPHAYDYINEKNSSYVYSLWVGDNYYENPSKENFPSYEETVEAAFKYVLENLI